MIPSSRHSRKEGSAFGTPGLHTPSAHSHPSRRQDNVALAFRLLMQQSMAAMIFTRRSIVFAYALWSHGHNLEKKLLNRRRSP